MKKNPTSVRISDDAKKLLALLSLHMGITQSAVLETAIRDLARKHKITKEQTIS